MNGFIELFADYDVLGAFWMNIKLTAISAVGAFILGTILALFRISPVASFRTIGTAYVNIVRNTPLTIIMVLGVLAVWGQLKIEFFSDFSLNFFTYAIIALSLYHASFVCEAIRSGVNTVPRPGRGRRAIGLSFLPAARIIVLPQALRGRSPLGNTLIALTKNTTVAAAASVAEASGLMSTMIEFNPNLMTYIFLTIAIGFCLLVIPMGFLTTWLSDKLAVAR